MIRLRSLVVVVATAALAAGAYGEPTITPKDGAAESAAKRAEPAKHSDSSGFKQDVKDAWSQTREGVHRAGRDIRDGARSFGRATRDAFQTGWRKVKGAFAGSSAREGSERSSKSVPQKPVREEAAEPRTASHSLRINGLPSPFEKLSANGDGLAERL